MARSPRRNPSSSWFAIGGGPYRNQSKKYPRARLDLADVSDIASPYGANGGSNLRAELGVLPDVFVPLEIVEGAALDDCIRDEAEWAGLLYVAPIELDERNVSAN